MTTLTPEIYFKLVYESLVQILGTSPEVAQAMVAELRGEVNLDGKDLNDLDPPIYIACDLAQVKELTEKQGEHYARIFDALA